MLTIRCGPLACAGAPQVLPALFFAILGSPVRHCTTFGCTGLKWAHQMFTVAFRPVARTTRARFPPHLSGALAPHQRSPGGATTNLGSAELARAMLGRTRGLLLVRHPIRALRPVDRSRSQRPQHQAITPVRACTVRQPHHPNFRSWVLMRWRFIH